MDLQDEGRIRNQKVDCQSQERAGAGDHPGQTVAEASRAYDLLPSEIECWEDEGKRSMEIPLRTQPENLREQYERQLQELQQAYAEAMLELRARNKLKPCWTRSFAYSKACSVMERQPA